MHSIRTEYAMKQVNMQTQKQPILSTRVQYEHTRTMRANAERAYSFLTQGNFVLTGVHAEIHAAVTDIVTQPSNHPERKMGFAIKRKAQPVRISPIIRILLTQMFDHGRITTVSEK